MKSRAPERPELERLLRDAAEALERIDPIERGLVLAAQQRSFARGNVGLSSPDVTAEVVRRAYDEMHPGEVAYRELLRLVVDVFDGPRPRHVATVLRGLAATGRVEWPEKLFG